MIRTFIALQLEPPIRRRLHELGRTIPDSRPVPHEQIHLTLRFLGDIEGTMFRLLQGALTEIRSPPFDLVICGVGHFPPRGKPRIVWAGIEPNDRLTALRHRLNAVLDELGFPREQRKFHPHVTIARCRGTSSGRLADILAGNSLLRSPSFPIRSFTLFSSTLTPAGAVHHVEADYPLR